MKESQLGETVFHDGSRPSLCLSSETPECSRYCASESADESMSGRVKEPDGTKTSLEEQRSMCSVIPAGTQYLWVVTCWEVSPEQKDILALQKQGAPDICVRQEEAFPQLARSAVYSTNKTQSDMKTGCVLPQILTRFLRRTSTDMS